MSETQASVKVGKVPGEIKEVFIDDGTSVGEVLELSGLSDQEGYSVRMNGNPVEDLDDLVTAGASITLVRDVRGNEASVKVGKVPGEIKQIFVESTTTVREVLELAGLSDQEGYSVRMNGNPVEDLSAVVSDGASITLVRDVRGNG